MSPTGFTQPGTTPDVMPRDASTVVLLRAREADAFEVFLVKRHGASAFMGGAYVFPGGKVDREDASLTDAATAERLAARLSPTPGRARTDEESAGLLVAAIREVFEEVGVLFARGPSGPLDEATLARVRAARAEDLPLSAIMAAEGLALDLDALMPWAHWITPSLETRRFDTHFFLALAPEAQVVDVDARESTEGAWMTPAEALTRHEAGEILLPPPTLANLDELARLGALAAVLAAARARRVPAILPKVGAVGESMAIILPWDPLFAQTDGQALPDESTEPAAASYSRVVLEGERWRLRDGRLAPPTS